MSKSLHILFIKIVILQIIITCIIFEKIYGQVANYTFTQSTTTYNSIYATGLDFTNKGSFLFATNVDDDVEQITLPFYFMVNGVTYYEANLSSNGFITFGTVAPSANNYSPIASLELYSAAFAAFAIDLEATGSRPRFKLSGVTPNRIYTIEYNNFRRIIGGSGEFLNFQIKLYETSNKLEVVYGTNTIPSNSAQIRVGLRGLLFTDFNNRSSATDWSASSSGFFNTSSITSSSTTFPPSGLTFTWSPNISCLAPTGSAGVLTFTSITNTAIIGAYLPALLASGYVVIRTPTSAPPPTPVNGQSYQVGQFLSGGGYVENYGPLVAVASTGLIPNTQYWYWIYPYNTSANCSLFPIYKTTAPSMATTTTLACSVGPTLTNSVTITTTGVLALTAILPTSWSLGHLPLPCENAIINFDVAGSANESLTLNFDLNFSIKNLSIINKSVGTGRKNLTVVCPIYRSVMVDGDLSITCPSTNVNDSCFYASTGFTMVTGNTILGGSSAEGNSNIGSLNGYPDQTLVINGNLTFGPKAFTIEEHSRFIMDGTSTQTITNNTNTSPYPDALLFDAFKIGNGIKTPTVIFAGSNPASYMNDKGGVLDITPNSKLILPANFFFNAEAISSPNFNTNFLLNAGSQLILGGNSGGQTGSNFPLNFNPPVINNTSTVEYNGSNAITQTVYAGVNYGNLLLSTISSSGRAIKNNTASVTANTSINVNTSADFILGAGVNSVGPFNVQTNGGLYCGTNVVTGVGAFTLNNLGYLGMGSPQGITNPASSMSGNVQMTASRNFSTAGNYIYNGSVPQITGNGLPNIVNDLTTDNPTTVTVAVNQLVNGVDSLKQGVFDIGTNVLTINGVGRLNSVGGFMKANRGIVEMKGTAGIAQELAGSWFVNRNISTLINANTTGITIKPTLDDTLLIASALLYGNVTNSLITTNNNITLLSRDTATARFGEIVLGSGNNIIGNVHVERYISTSRKWRHLAWNTTSNQNALESWMEKNTIPNGNIKPNYGTIVTDEKTTWAAGNFDSRSVSGPSVKYFDVGANAYIGIPNTTVYQMNTHNAYYNYVRGDRSALPANTLISPTILRSTGTLKTGSINFSIPATKFEAVGNPYASAVDVRMLDTTNLTTTFYVWDPQLTGIYGLGAYQILRPLGSDYVVMPGGGTYGPLNSIVDTLESGQAMFVRAREITGTLGFKENAKTVGARVMSFTGGTTNTEVASFAILNLVVNNTKTVLDAAMVQFDDIYGNNIDFEDAQKISNINENVSFKRNNTLLSIERRQQIKKDDTLFLNLAGVRLAKYEWDFSFTNIKEDGRTAFLIDKYLNNTTALHFDSVNAVQFDIVNIPAAYAPDRFMIVFKQLPITPLKFISIAANRNTDNSVSVDWAVINEKNVNTYSLQQSVDGVYFADIITQLPIANNGGNPTYNRVDANACINKNWYRVIANNTNGSKVYSETVQVKKVDVLDKPTIAIYPNPVVDGIVNLSLYNQPKGNYILSILNTNGQIIYTEKIIVENSNTTKKILLSNAAAGNYALKIEGDATAKKLITFLIQ